MHHRAQNADEIALMENSWYSSKRAGCMREDDERKGPTISSVRLHLHSRGRIHLIIAKIGQEAIKSTGSHVEILVVSSFADIQGKAGKIREAFLLTFFPVLSVLRKDC